MNIMEIYDTYHIPPNLAEHMRKVAGVGSVIARAWIKSHEVNVDLIAKALLVHDLANIIKFNFDTYPIAGEEDRTEYWKSIQREFMQKYGSDEHQAVIEMLHELKLENRIIEIIKRMPLVDNEHKIAENELELKICWYADWRVSPHGITTAEKRFNEFINRLVARGATTKEIQRYSDMKWYCLELERELQTNINFALADIDSNAIQPVITSFDAINF